MNKEVEIVNPNEDFHMIQNYLLQLVAEKRITASAYVLYGFYRSLRGWEKIQCGVEYISANTGLSTGNITKCNRLLKEAGLILLRSGVANITNLVKLKDPRKLPRRKLVSVHKEKTKSRSPSESVRSSGELHRSPDEKIKIENKKRESRKRRTTTGGASRQEASTGSVDSTTHTPCFPAPRSSERGAPRMLTPDQLTLVEAYTREWEFRSGEAYPREDDDDRCKVSEIDDPRKALKYIRTLWALDDVDGWVRDSDHKFSVFVKEWKSGKLKEHFPKTVDGHTEALELSRRREEEEIKRVEEEERLHVEECRRLYEDSVVANPLNPEWYTKGGLKWDIACIFKYLPAPTMEAIECQIERIRGGVA